MPQRYSPATMAQDERLLAALNDLAERPRFSALRIGDGRASVVLDAGGLDAAGAAALEDQARCQLLTVPDIGEARVLVTRERTARRLLAVASGKGGVGKSTVAAGLAGALTAAGLRIGLIDADVYGPSLPTLMDVAGIKPEAPSGKLAPVPTPAGIPLLSIGQLVPAGRALAWRGPMASNALAQLVDADWPPLDLIVMDLPPGTGDIQLSIVQKHRPAAALIVTTPQDLALIDAARAADLFRTAAVPILGLVENMAGYRCPHCGEWSDPFGTADSAARLELPLIARVPLSLAVREGTGAQATAFEGTAAAVRRWLETI